MINDELNKGRNTNPTESTITPAMVVPWASYPLSGTFHYPTTKNEHKAGI